MAYTKQTWHDKPTLDTPLNATRLGHIEDGLEAAAAAADTANSALAAKASLSGAAFTGPVTVPTPTAAGHAATKGYVDSAISTAGGASTLDDLTDVTIASPAAGQVLKYNGSAWVNDTDATGGSGGSSGSFGYTPDLAGANDLNFATLGAHGGTVLGSPSTTPSIVDGALRLVSGTSGSADLKAVEWTAPSGAFTIMAKVRRKPTLGATFGSVVLFLSRSSNRAGAQFYKSGTHNSNSGWSKYTAPTTRSASGGDTLAEPSTATYFYLKAAYDGTNVTYSISSTGHPDSFIAVLTETAATFLGGAPTAFGIGIDAFGTTAMTAYVEWIDVT